MSATALKNKINRSLTKLNASNLQSAYLILKELVNQQNYADFKIDKRVVDTKINKGIQELNNGEGTDFMLFLHEMRGSYDKKK